MAHVLVVDDEEAVRRMIRDVLVRAGHQVAMAANGDEALAKINADAFDIVLLDMIMPTKEGVETLATLRKMRVDLPVIAMSGGGRTRQSESLLDAARMFGATRVLEKPFRMATLIDLIAACLAEKAGNQGTDQKT